MVQTIRTSRPLSEHTVYTRSHIESTSRTDRLQRPIGRAHGRYKTTLRWCNLSNPVYVAYHDAEWAVPSHDDHHLFEMLVLETFQAGLSWETILNKLKRFRQAFDGFDIERIRRYDENKIAELMNDPGIIRNRRKIVATVGNANAFRDIQTSYGSFDDYIWRFTGRHVIYETGMTTSLCPTPSQWISRRTACDSSAPPSSTPICNPSASSMHMSWMLLHRER